jgi:hypothetical protein
VFQSQSGHRKSRVVRGCPRPLQANAGMVPRPDDRFLPNSLQFIIHQSSYHYDMTVWKLTEITHNFTLTIFHHWVESFQIFNYFLLLSVLLFLSPGDVFAIIHLFVTQLPPPFYSMKSVKSEVRDGAIYKLSTSLCKSTGPCLYTRKYSSTDFDLLVKQLKHLSLAILVIYWTQLFIDHVPFIGQYRHEMKTNTCNIYHLINYCKMKINSESSCNGRYWLEL